MKEHHFIFILTENPDEEQADRLYSNFDDGTIFTIAGVPQVHFHRKAKSLEDALRSAIADVKASGFAIARIEIEPESLLQEVK